jgi:cell division protein FtsI/penicillin-binding protein 2
MSRASQDSGTLSSRRRIIWLGALLTAWMVVVLVRLTFIQVGEHDHYRRLALRGQRTSKSTLPLRGKILDREGKVLAMSVINESLLIDQVLFNDVPLTEREKKKEGVKEQRIAEKKAKAVEALAAILGMNEDEFSRMLVGTNKYLWIKRNLLPEEAEAVDEQLRLHDLKGITLVEEEQRDYPFQYLAAHLLGYLGVNDQSDERIGRAGIEQMMNHELTGRRGEFSQMINAGGVPYHREYLPPRHGNSVYLTIDQALQRKAEFFLQQAVEQHKAKGGGMVIMQPGTGDILALANYPTYDPNQIDPNVASAMAYVNQAVVSPYEPGSIFKIITYAAAIDQGIITPDEMIDCGNGQIAIGSRIIRDTHTYGRISIADSFAKSSNVGAIRIAQRLGKETFHRYIRDFGFGSVTGLGLPAESSGIVHAPVKWRPDSIGSVAIGQEISVTLIQAVTAVAAIANNGVLVQPRIVSRVVGANGVTFDQPAGPAPREVIKPETARQMVKLLERVVTDGTGRHAVKLEGYTAAGKTGTPQKSGRSGYAPGRYMPSFLGFVPAVNPQFAIVVMIDEPSNGSYYGGVVAAPVFSMVAEAALTGGSVLPDQQSYRERLQQLVQRSAEAGGEQDLADGDEVVAEPEMTSQRSALITGGSSVPVTGSVLSAVGASAGSAGPPRGNSATAQVTKPAPIGNSAESTMPDLRGQGMKSVIRICSGLGLKLRFDGNGMVVKQYPAPGTRVQRGGECRIELR